MREAVIASTPVGRAYRGAFNDTQAQTLGGHAIAQAIARAHVDPVTMCVGGGMGAAGLFEIF